VDIPSLICALIVFVTLWRAKTLYLILKDIRKEYLASLNPAPVQTTPSTDDEEENPKPKSQRWFAFIDAWQHAAMKQLLLFILDLPFFMLTIFISLAPWRYWALKMVRH
jgi:hypothetical protein